MTVCFDSNLMFFDILSNYLIGLISQSNASEAGMWNKFFQFRQFCYKVHIDLKMQSSRSHSSLRLVTWSRQANIKTNQIIEKVNRGTLVDGSSTFYY